MIIVFFIFFVVFLVILLPIALIQSGRREAAAKHASCPKCGHDAKVYTDDTGVCTKCRAKLIRSAGGSLIVK